MSDCRAPTKNMCAIERCVIRTTEMGAALQRFATDTTCNDTRHADGESRELVNSVDKGFGHGRSYGSRGTRLRPSLHDVTTRVTTQLVSDTQPEAANPLPSGDCLTTIRTRPSSGKLPPTVRWTSSNCAWLVGWNLTPFG